MPPLRPPAAVLFAVAVTAPLAAEVSVPPLLFPGVGLLLLVFTSGWVTTARLVSAALTFAGFETTAVHIGQTRHLRRVMPACVTLLALLFAAASWAIGGTAPEGAVARTFGPWAVGLGRAVLVVGLLAAMIALQEVIARHLNALGRERVLPAALGRRAPASAVPTVVAGAVIGGYAYAGAGIDRWPERAGAAGILVLLGLGYGVALRRADPVRYAGIGLGGAAVVVTPPLPALPRQRIPGAHRPERVSSEELTG
ncbi:hypothetical protein ACWEOZ_03710 [Actinoplanes sp. NPDC004185]